jgi:hypothetical protein
VSLPSPQVTLRDGSVHNGPAACGELNTTQRLQVTADAVGIPPHQYRELLAAPEYEHAIHLVRKQSDLEDVLGPYMPRTRYLQPNQVETFFVCADPAYVTSQ